MGIWLTNNHIEISDKSFQNGSIVFYGYKDFNEDFISQIVENRLIQYLQISKELPAEAYQIADFILEKRPDIIFRIYGLYSYEKFDISFLEKMPHLEQLRIDCHLGQNHALIDFNIISNLHLKSLSLDAFNLRNYSFMKNISTDIEELSINADTMRGGIIFDCEWLLRFDKLKSLWLGKKAKKNIAYISQLRTLRALSLKGIKLTDFSFLKQIHLEKLELLWSSNNELGELGKLKSLKEIGLWRINKLCNIEFLSDLENLEVIKLQDLKHITCLPDLSKLKYVNKLVIDNTGININELDGELQKIIVPYWK